jgi:hypothetical protein
MISGEISPEISEENSCVMEPVIFKNPAGAMLEGQRITLLHYYTYMKLYMKGVCIPVNISQA